MNKVRRIHQGLAYGDGRMQTAARAGQLLQLVGDDLFAVNTDPTRRSFGILIADTAAGAMPGVLCGGVAETEIFSGVVKAGYLLKTNTEGFLTAGLNEGELAVAQAISVSGGTLKFKLFI